MKSLIITLFFSFSIIVYGQGCNGATKSGLYSVYQKYQNKGLKVIHQKSGFDYMEYIIDGLAPQEINQMSIDVAYEIHVNGVDYTYNKFTRKHFYISKDEYIANRCYLGMLSIINGIVLKNISN